MEYRFLDVKLLSRLVEQSFRSHDNESIHILCAVDDVLFTSFHEFQRNRNTTVKDGDHKVVDGLKKLQSITVVGDMTAVDQDGMGNNHREYLLLHKSKELVDTSQPVNDVAFRGKNSRCPFVGSVADEEHLFGIVPNS